MSATVEKFSPVVIPYFAEKERLPADILSKIYQRLVSDDILPDLVPENVITEQEFIDFVSGAALLSLFLDVATNQFAGLAWITQVEEGQFIKKGCASVAFFRNYWKPRQTRIFGRIVLGHWFNLLGFNAVYAMTPASNILAVRYSQRVGFRYLATLPGFTSRRGEITAGRIAYLTRDEFNAQPD